MGVAFIAFYVPETKRLTLEEMDIKFGSIGAAAADAKRMQEINREIGLEDAIRGLGGKEGETSSGDEKSPSRGAYGKEIEQVDDTVR